MKTLIKAEYEDVTIKISQDIPRLKPSQVIDVVDILKTTAKNLQATINQLKQQNN